MLLSIDVLVGGDGGGHVGELGRVRLVVVGCAGAGVPLSDELWYGVPEKRFAWFLQGWARAFADPVEV